MRATKEMNSVSGQVDEQSTRYLGILNGVMYRINTDMESSGKTFELVPFEVQPAAIVEQLEPAETIQPQTADREEPPPTVPPSVEVTSRRVARAEPIIDETRAEKKERTAKLFNRDDGDPLPAGHPDLWNLLVAGTCLEGSTFRSA
jgi:hypothetical protein